MMQHELYTFKELLMEMRGYVQEKKDANITIDKGDFDSWLRKHGWMKQEVEGRNWWIKGSLVCQRHWYIDFAYDPCRRSELDCTKNVIIMTEDLSEPKVYWEVRYFAATLNKDNADFNMLTWWKNQKHSFAKLQSEFQFHNLTLLPSRRSAFAQKKPWNIPPTRCTTETLMATNGLIVMLLHFAGHTRRNAYRLAAKDILIDLMRRLFSETELEKPMIPTLTFRDARGGAPEGRGKADVLSETTSSIDCANENIVDSLMNAFIHRNRCEQVWRHLKHDVGIITERINAVILKKQVGQQDLLSEQIQQVKHSMENDPTYMSNAVRKKTVHKKRKHKETLSTNGSMEERPRDTNVKNKEKETNINVLDDPCVHASMSNTRTTKEDARKSVRR